MLGNGLITEEVLTVQAATELLQETKHIVDAVHHGEAQKVLLPIKRGCGRKTVDGLNEEHGSGFIPSPMHAATPHWEFV